MLLPFEHAHFVPAILNSWKSPTCDTIFFGNMPVLTRRQRQQGFSGGPRDPEDRLVVRVGQIIDDHLYAQITRKYRQLILIIR